MQTVCRNFEKGKLRQDKRTLCKAANFIETNRFSGAARRAAAVRRSVSGTDTSMKGRKHCRAAATRAGAQAVGAPFYSLDASAPDAPTTYFVRSNIHWNARGNLAAYRFIAPRVSTRCCGR